MLFKLHCFNTNTSAFFFILQDGQTALMAAARNGHASVCTLLIEREARVDCQNNVSMYRVSFRNIVKGGQR